LERKEGTNGYVAHIDDRVRGLLVDAITDQKIRLVIDGEQIEFRITTSEVEFKPPVERQAIESETNQMVSPMPGKVISVQAREGRLVDAGDPLVIIESMKMETVLRSDRRAIVEKISVNAGDAVRRGQLLLTFVPVRASH
jgi:biotin carboxyl carrier protein